MNTLVQQVRDYAAWLQREYLSDEDRTPPLIALAADADIFTAPHVAALLLIDNEARADAPFRQAEALFDPRLSALATAIGWEA